MALLERYHQKFQVMANLALNIANLSTCKRLKVGAVIVNHEFTRVLSVGYNGPPRNMPNDSCTGETPCGCIHAEANALIKLEHRSKHMFMICTHTPCYHCEGLMVNAGIDEVFAWDAYRIPPKIYNVHIIGDDSDKVLERWSALRRSR